MQSITVQGASVFCLINGTIFGRVTGFSYTSETQRKALYTIDSHDPADLIPTVTRLTGRLEVVRTKSDGGLEGAGIVAPYAFLSNEKFITIMILARETMPYYHSGNNRLPIATTSLDPNASDAPLIGENVNITDSDIKARELVGLQFERGLLLDRGYVDPTLRIKWGTQKVGGHAYGNRTVIFRTDNAQVVNQSWQVNARGLMTGSFTFEALDWSNEVENAF
jgi:hypothetical protein